MRHWGKWLLQTIDNEATEYIKKAGRDVELAQNNWAYFRKAWDDYLEERKIKTGDGQAEFPPNYGVVERDAFYKKVSWDGWGGSSGHDAPMIAYFFSFASAISKLDRPPPVLILAMMPFLEAELEAPTPPRRSRGRS